LHDGCRGTDGGWDGGRDRLRGDDDGDGSGSGGNRRFGLDLPSPPNCIVAL